MPPVIPRSRFVLVVGAGPAGLAVSRELRRLRVEHRVLERGDAVGASWRNLYDSLVLHTGKHLSHLPGMPFPRGTPLFPTREQFVAYLEAYAAGAPVETHCAVHRLVRLNHTWRALTTRGEMRAHDVIVTTGIMANPRIPEIAGSDAFAGGIRHSIEYRRPEPFAGKRVLVIGCGNSAGEIATELARSGVDVTLSVRSGANAVPRTIAGVPVQYLGVAIRRLPPTLRDGAVRALAAANRLRWGPSPIPPSPKPPLATIPLIGMELLAMIRGGRITVRPGVESLTPDGARFTNGETGRFDELILATGFAPALGILGDLVHRDEGGFAMRRDRVTSADQPNLHFVGQNYDSAGGLFNIARDAPLAARAAASAQ